MLDIVLVQIGGINLQLEEHRLEFEFEMGPFVFIIYTIKKILD
jgi:hypothetical protein